MSPVPWLPEPTGVGEILGNLVTAQAAIVALSLAVTLFMMQGIRSRGDVDDRMYREFVRRSWMREILWGSLVTLGVSSALLLLRGFLIGEVGPADSFPEFRNYVLAAGSAFLLNLFLVGALFERAIRHSRPDHWIALRRDICTADVREAVSAFLLRTGGARDRRATEPSDFSALRPDRNEGSADEAVRALLDEARRAMSERRPEEFKRWLEFIWEQVKYAMDEIKRSGYRWSAPGGQPAWPPLGELSRNLDSLREAVIREGDREYLLALLRIDYRIASHGMRERCGEMFTVGLTGYRANYRIANRIGSGEFRGLIRDSFSLNLQTLSFGGDPAEIVPYAREIIRHQERILSDAMHSDQSSDYEQLDREFRAVRNASRLSWRLEEWPSSQLWELFEGFEQEYRIALMGLAGRAIVLAESNRLDDVKPFLNIARQACANLGQQADDIVPALSYDDNQYSSLWQEWEGENAVSYEVTSIFAERYPLIFFTLRIMELAAESMPDLDFRGRSQRILDWFSNNAESLESYVHADPPLSALQRREFAQNALHAAVRRDKVAEDYEIIARELSSARVRDFKSEVCAAAISSNSVERVFDESGSRLYLREDDSDAPQERGIRQLRYKGYLTDSPDGALIGYVPLNGGQFGVDLSQDLIRRFCEELAGAPVRKTRLDTPTEFLQEIDRAIDELGDPEHLAIVLAGDWSHLQVRLRIEDPDEYEASWKLPNSDRMGVRGRYRGYPILSARGQRDQCVYVVNLSGWGQFVRARTHGDEDLRIEIKPISGNRALELLKANPDHFASEPDEESKLRRLQAHVEIVVGARTGFRVADPARARQLVPIELPDVNDEASQG